MKKYLFFILILCGTISCNTKDSSVKNNFEKINPKITSKQSNQEIYSSAMKDYELGNYKNASALFKTIINSSKLDDISTNTLYNGACIFSLAEENKMSFEILDYLTSKRFYSSYNHILSDIDLNNLHSESKWKTITKKIAENKKTEPERLRQKIKTELFKAKDILLAENGKLWKENIWSDDIIVLDFDNIIYTTKPLQNSKTNDSIIYYKKIPENLLGFSNAVQKFNEKDYAVVLTNYLDDNSETIIHELFHILQYKHITLNGEPITYLDNFDAREWLRLEYQALKNALVAIDKQKTKSEVEKYINDAFVFRKARQNKYKDYLQKEIEIETLEGLASYTGIVLSNYPNKYEKAIQEINQREKAETYTRPFSYATGVAYGLIFDYLRLNWKNGLDEPYDFLKIYETLHLKKHVSTDAAYLETIRKRNNYLEIHEQEVERKTKQEKLLDFYTKMFFTNPTLRVTLITEDYGRTYDMNGTFVLDSENTVYSNITGKSKSPLDFGDFKTLEGKEKLGVGGVIGNWKDEKMTFVFPLPLKISGDIITGESYEISLNKGWGVEKVNKKGDLVIVKTKNNKK